MDYNITNYIIYNKLFKVIDVLNHNLNSLIIPDDIDIVNCPVNNLKELLLPDNLKSLICWSNNINELKLNDNLIGLTCDIFVCVNNINNKELAIIFI